jgi:hypothetical protein
MHACPTPLCLQSSKGSSSLKADELMDLLKADISLNDVPQSGEPDEQVSFCAFLVGGPEAARGGWEGGEGFLHCALLFACSAYLRGGRP